MKLPTQKLQAVALILSSALLAAACSGVHTAAGGSGSGGTTGPFAIGGTVSGLTGTGLVLQDNAGDNLTISANGCVYFSNHNRHRRSLRRHRGEPTDQSRTKLRGYQRQR